MLRRTWIAIPAMAVGVLLALLAGAPGGNSAQAALADDLLADGMTREEMAGLYPVLALAQFVPPACVAGEEMFSDVPATHPFCSWIEELARRGIASGCTASKYCPGNPVNRAQMAVFVVKAMEACPTMDPADEMVRVGGVCVDRYEASVWDAPNGETQLVTETEIDAVCPDDGQDCKGKIFARSVAGVEPATSITWFQAQQALANSGKRLPTNAEWQMAVSGTPDHPGPCNTDTFDLELTGSSPGCVSDWDAFDMVGNVWEWVADWVPLSEGCGAWSSFGGFSSDDRMCLSGAAHPAPGPGALFRGGYNSNVTVAGPFAIQGDIQPSFSISLIGFRGAR